MSSLVPIIPWLLVAGPAADAVVGVVRGRRGPIVGSCVSLGIALVGLVVLDAPAADVGGLLAWDPLGGVVAAFVLAMSIVIRIYAARAMAGDLTSERIDVAAAAVASVTALVATASNPIVFALGWTATTPVVVLLVRYDGRAANLDAARTLRRNLTIGDAALLLASLLAVTQLGIDRLRPGVGVEAGTSTSVVAALVVVAAVARAALPPFHRWLTASIAAPTAVSALLHAGVVNGSGLLLVRWSEVTYRSTPTVLAVAVFGLVASVIGVAVMQTRADVKSGLVWSTVAQMGFMVLQAGTGLAGPAIAHLLGHGMYKAHLFLASGSALDTRPAPHRHRSRGWLVVTAAIAAGATAFAMWAVRPAFLELGWVVVLPVAFLVATITVGLAPWFPGSRGRMAAAAASSFGFAVAAVGVTAVIDHVLEPSLPAFVPAAGGAAAVGAVALAVLAAGLFVRLRSSDDEWGDRAYVRAVTAGAAPIRTPVGAS